MSSHIFILLFTAFVSFGLAKSPTGGYAPGVVQCPTSGSLLREGNSLSDQEKDYIEQRQSVTRDALKHYLRSKDLEDFDLEKFIGDNTTINIAIAISGGGYRSMLTGAGAIAAFDNRTIVEYENPLGGILQSSNYISALSGGSWLLGSLLMQDFPSIDEVVLEDPYDVWNLTRTRQLLNDTNLLSIVFPLLSENLEGLYTHVNNWDANTNHGIDYDITSKEKAGFNTTITDVWSRALAYQLFPAGDDAHGASATLSDIRDKRSFKNHNTPFPLIMALARDTQEDEFDLDTPSIEFNPYEMGSFEPAVNAFTDVEYLGTELDDGKPTNSCFAGFDNAGFVVGTSSSLFNQYIKNWLCKGCFPLTILVEPLVKAWLEKLSRTKQDVATYVNPFRGSRYTNSSIATSDTLYLYDGGLSGEGLALSSLATTYRALDAVFAVDSTQTAVNGSALFTAYKRQFIKGAPMVIPYVPDEATFLKLGLTERPTFFGCDASKLSGLVKDGVVPPVVIYLANRDWSFNSATNLYKLSYTDAEKKAMITNGFEVASFKNSTVDGAYGVCVACALIKREQERRGIEPSDECNLCFQSYCYDYRSNINSAMPLANSSAATLTNSSAAILTNSSAASLSNSTRL